MLLLFRVEYGNARAHVLAHSKDQAAKLYLKDVAGTDSTDAFIGTARLELQVKSLMAAGPRVIGCWEEP